MNERKKSSLRPNILKKKGSTQVWWRNNSSTHAFLLLCQRRLRLLLLLLLLLLLFFSSSASSSSSSSVLFFFFFCFFFFFFFFFSSSSSSSSLLLLLRLLLLLFVLRLRGPAVVLILRGHHVAQELALRPRRRLAEPAEPHDGGHVWHIIAATAAAATATGGTGRGAAAGGGGRLAEEEAKVPGVLARVARHGPCRADWAEKVSKTFSCRAAEVVLWVSSSLFLLSLAVEGCGWMSRWRKVALGGALTYLAATGELPWHNVNREE